jgi:hypothetical protein
MLADRIGIERTLMTMAFMPLLAAALALPLPGRSRKKLHSTRAADVAGAEPE